MRRPQVIPLADAPALRPAIRRTTIVVASLAAGLIGLAAWSIVTSANVDARPRFLPPQTSGVVVLDVSASISEDTYARIRETLRRLVATESRFGLVLFSDIAYEALPPGTPAAELAPLLRFFRLRPQGASQSTAALPVANPWTRTFTGGTRISSGLVLARQILERDGIRNGAVLLVSDLSDDRSDGPRLQDEILRYSKLKIPLRVVGLNALPEDARFFKQLLGDPRFVVPAQLPQEGTSGISGLVGDVPRTLLALVLALLALLALNEHWAGRLTWRRA